MKGIFKDFFSQCARPEGFLGRLMLRFMNFGHAPLTNWGLGLVSFGNGMTMLDIGCGGGATLKRLLKKSPNGKVYGIDISAESVAKAKSVNQKLLGSRVFVEQGLPTVCRGTIGRSMWSLLWRPSISGLTCRNVSRR